MLMLLFQVENQPWAIAATEVQDLIPLTTIQPYVQAPKNVQKKDAQAAAQDSVAVGLLDYHGERLPVLDVSAAIAQSKAPDTFSTRIAIVEVASPAQTETADDRPKGAAIRCGLVLEKAYQTAQLSEPVSLPVHSPYVKQALKGTRQVVRQLAIAPLVHHVMDSLTAHSNDSARNYRLGTA